MSVKMLLTAEQLYEKSFERLIVGIIVKVTQGHRNCLYSTYHISLPISGLQERRCLALLFVFPRYYHIYSVRDWLRPCEVVRSRKSSLLNFLSSFFTFFFPYAFFLTYLLPYLFTSDLFINRRRSNLALVLFWFILCCSVFCYGCMFAFVVF